MIFVFADFNECMQLPCRNGGTCKNLDGSFECICPEGYTGTLCTGGIPSLSVLSFSLFDQSNYYYSCTLTLIYLTFFFFLDINECLSNPCQHGARCIDTPGSFQCICPPQWEGTLCDKGKAHSINLIQLLQYVNVCDTGLLELWSRISGCLHGLFFCHEELCLYF